MAIDPELFKDFSEAIMRGDPYAGCPYCGWSNIVHPVGDVKQIDCTNCQRSTSLELSYEPEEVVS